MHQEDGYFNPHKITFRSYLSLIFPYVPCSSVAKISLILILILIFALLRAGCRALGARRYILQFSTDQRTFGFAHDSTTQGAGFVHVKDADRHIVVAR